MQSDRQTHQTDVPEQADIQGLGNRRGFVRLLAGASVTLAAALAGCSNMQAQPRGQRPKTYIRGNGGPSGKGRG